MPLTEEEQKAADEAIALKVKEEELKKKEEELKKKEEKTKDPEYLQSELDKVIKQRDDVKKERRKLLEDVEALKTTISSTPTNEEVEDLKKQFGELKEFREAVEKKTEEEDLKKKTELERTQIKFNKELDKIKEEMETERKRQNELLVGKEKEKNEISAQVGMLRGYKLEGEIIKASTRYKALKPEQIVKLLKDDFTYNETLDRFEFLVYNPKDPKKLMNELDVDERVKEFLSLEDSDNLVEADVKKGTRTDLHNADNKKVTKKFDISTSKYDPEDEDIKRQADLKGMSVEDHIKTLMIRDEVTEKRKK